MIGAEPGEVAISDRRLVAEMHGAVRRVRLSLALGYAVPVTAASAATLTWFRRGEFVAAGDIGPYLRNGLASELGTVWNHRVTGAGSTSAEITRCLDVALVRIVGFLGASEVVAQQLFYAIALAFAAFGAAYLAGVFTSRPAVIAGTGLVGAFNPYVLVAVPNYLPMWAIGTVGLLAGIVLRAARGRSIAPLAFGAASVSASILAVNPPTFAVVVLAVVAVAMIASAVVGPGGFRRAVTLIARAAPWILLLNLWWVVPLMLTHLRPAGVEFAAETDASTWAWSHADNTLANVASLKASWAWRSPDLLPFASALDKSPWNWMRGLLPLAALAAPLVTRRPTRRAALVLAGAAGVLVMVGKGLHPPWSGINGYLYHRVPGFWLLREPMTKVGVLILLCFVALLSIGAESLLDRASTAPRRRILWAGLAVVVTGAVLYSHPLWTGAVIPDERGGLPSAHVAVPDEWRAASAVVNESSRPGKVLLLPLDPFYQMTTTWGYHGVDEIARQLVRRPVIQRLPGGYYEEANMFGVLVDRVESALAAGEVGEVPGLLRALGVSHVIIRHDLTSGQVNRPTADPDTLTAALGSTEGIADAGRFGLLDVYEFTAGAGPVRAMSAGVGLVRAAEAAFAGEVGRLSSSEFALRPDSGPVDSLSIEVADERYDEEFRLARAGTYRVETRPPDSSAYRLRVIDEHASGRRLELIDALVATLDGNPLPAQPSARLVLGDATLISIGDEIRPLELSPSLVTLDSSTPITAYRTDAMGSGLGDLTEVEDCAAGEADPPLGLAAEPIDDGVRLRARSHRSCVSAGATSLVAGDPYWLHLEARAVAGLPPAACLWLEGPNHCAELPDLPADSTWAAYDTLVDVPAGTDGLRLYLYADGPGHDDTVVEYRSLRLLPVVATDSTVIEPGPPGEEERALAAGEHRLTVTQPLPLPTVGPFSELADCHALDESSPEEAGLAAEVIEHGVRLRARAHTACVWTEIAEPDLTLPYRLRLTARTVSGRDARLCVWQVGPGRCAGAPPLRTSNAWLDYDATFTLEPGTTGVQLYLYADGQEDPPTITEYRDIEVRPVQPTTISLTAVTPAPDPPTVRLASEAPDRYEVEVDEADGQFVLTLAESYAPGWQVHGLPEGATAEHVMIDGYANGWLIDGHGDLRLDLEYAPGRWARRAQAISLGAAILAFLLVTVPRVRRRVRTALESPDTEMTLPR